MANIITLPSKVDSCRDTKIFGEITPGIFQAVLDSIPAICRAVLNWEPLAVWFLGEIIRQIPLSGELLVLGHSEFGRILFSSDSSDIAVRQRIGRAIKSVKRCQLLSGFKAVDIRSGDVIEDGGKKEYFPTTYQLIDFFVVFLEFRDVAKEQDLMSLKPRERKITQYAIAKSICDARGYAEIPTREKKEKPESSEKEQKEKSAKPCACACEGCKHCSLKIHATIPRSVDRRVTKQMVERDVQLLFERLVEHGQDWMNLNLRHQDFVRKALEEFNDAAARISKGVASHNKPGLKLVGGQPK